jgi:LytS/YehU family sensor histidine kinase
MMDFKLMGEILKDIAVMALIAYVTAQLPHFRRALHQTEYHFKDKLILIAIFGSFSALGNYLSIPIMGALAHTRLVGVVVGGLIGGPIVGLGAGIIGAIPRYFIGGPVVFPAVLTNVIVGYLSGLVCERYGARRIDFKIAFWCSVASQIILKTAVLTLSTSWQHGWEVEKALGIPTAIANTVGIMLFIYIVRDVFREQEKLQAKTAQQAMRVIRKASGLLRNGLNEESAKQVAKIIYQETMADAVAVTGRDKILAYMGVGADHHRVGDSFITEATKQAMITRKTIIGNDKASIGCPDAACPLSSVVSAPLLVNDTFYGTLKLYKTDKNAISPYEGELVQGIADFLSLQLVQAEMDAQTVLLAQAKYASLKSQIHPHFLFNTLGTIRAIMRTDTAMARDLILDLSEFLRQHVKPGKEIIRVKEEMECVKRYVRLEKARFGERIRVIEHISPETLEQTLPVFAIQVVVENAMKHGLSPKKQGGTVHIRVGRDQKNVFVTVEDDGIGISAERLAQIGEKGCQASNEQGIGIGLNNVHDRIQSMYGKEYGLSIQSTENMGTKVTICVPWHETGGRHDDERE